MILDLPLFQIIHWMYTLKEELMLLYESKWNISQVDIHTDSHKMVKQFTEIKVMCLLFE